MNAASSLLQGLPASEKWRTLLTTHGPRAATWALALALGVQAALVFFSITDSGGSARPVPAPAGASSHKVDVGSIISAHLWGTAPAPVLRADDKNVPQSNIPLVLTGVVATDDPRNGLAILGQTLQVTKVYAVGDVVPGGPKLYSVYSDRAVIDRDGHLESLTLPRQLSNGVIPNSPLPSASVLQSEPPVADRMRRLVTEQPGLIADIMRPQPVYQDSKLHGYRVFPGRNHQAFSRLGLRPGDLVTSINGTPLDDPMRGPEILRTLNTSPEARVTVLRNGQPQDLTLNLAQVAQEAEALAGSQGAGSEPAQSATQ